MTINCRRRFRDRLHWRERALRRLGGFDARVGNRHGLLLRQLLFGKELLIDVELHCRRQDDEVASEYLLDVATRIRGSGFAAGSASLHGYSRRIGSLMLLRSAFGCEVAAAARDNHVRRPRLNLHLAPGTVPRAIG